MGNAEPTPSSFAAWVPNDGEINESLSNTAYPVGSDEITHTVGPYGNNNGGGGQEDIVKSLQTTNNQGGKKFDIIVLGMQEAAFVNKTTKSNKDNVVNDTPTKSDAAATASSPSHFTHSLISFPPYYSNQQWATQNPPLRPLQPGYPTMVKSMSH